MSSPNTLSKLARGCEDLRLEGITTCVGFDDILDETLARNHAHFDTLIVVTSPTDRATQRVAAKHSAICVESDLFTKNGRRFNKGAAITQGFGHFQYHGWRLHLDVDCLLPDTFRRVLFNHTALDPACIYGCDRVDVRDRAGLADLDRRDPQHRTRYLLIPEQERQIGARFVSSLYGYVPIGFFQLWHASQQRDYPYSLGTAAHDDVLFAAQWPREKRVLLPSVLCYHLVTDAPRWGQNWDGRQQPRLDREVG